MHQYQMSLSQHGRSMGDRFENADSLTPAASLDLITSLPGLKYNPGFRQYSGYFHVSPARHLFYWFVESQGSPDTDPVLFWTNGGPGCSGLIGLGQEHGPFYIDENGDLTENPYSWNKLANVLYIEQPAGVGFSYVDDLTELKTGDVQAAQDNYRLIVQFLERFPDKQSNPFYISSESYGGHYIPQLAHEILKNDPKGAKINFKGFLVGNPYVDPFSNMVAEMETLYYHSVLSKPVYDKWKAACSDPNDWSFSPSCTESLKQIYMSQQGKTDPYALDFPVCLDLEGAAGSKRKTKHSAQGQRKRGLGGSSSSSSTLSLKDSQELLYPQKLGLYSAQAAVLRDHAVKMISSVPLQDSYQPCSGFYLTSYLRRQDVRKALHVHEKSRLDWGMCSRIGYSGDDVTKSTIPVYQSLVTQGLQGKHALNMLVFSGDDDSVCATSGTQSWIWDDLKVRTVPGSNWRAWTVNGQTAGFYTEFNLATNGTVKSNATFAFATVRGAGHEVPATRPVEGLELLRSYLTRQW